MIDASVTECCASRAMRRAVGHCEYGQDRNPLTGGDNLVGIGTCQTCRGLGQSETVTVTKSEHGGWEENSLAARIADSERLTAIPVTRVTARRSGQIWAYRPGGHQREAGPPRRG
jgi:hypothetical protein